MNRIHKKVQAPPLYDKKIQDDKSKKNIVDWSHGLKFQDLNSRVLEGMSGENKQLYEKLKLPIAEFKDLFMFGHEPKDHYQNKNLLTLNTERKEPTKK